MTEETILPAGEPPPEPVSESHSPPRRTALPLVLNVLGFVILAGAIFYVWQHPAGQPQAAIQSADQELTALSARLTRLEQRPATDLGPLTSRIDALEGRATDQSQLGSRLDAMSGRIESLSGRSQSGIDATKQQLEELTARIAALEANAGAIEVAGKRLTRIAKLQTASFALESGRPLGDLPDAPAPLARFAHTPPPTETGLRLLFTKAERGALDTPHPDRSDAPFLDRVLERAESLMTIRRGTTVLVGDPSAVALSNARAALDAGNLAGAVDAVQTLKGQPADAMAEWLNDAQALLNARAALAEMADRA